MPLAPTQPGWSKPRKLLTVAGILCLLGLVGFFLPTRTGAPRRVVILKGASVKEIASTLQREGLLKQKISFLVWARVSHGAMRPGVYTLTPGTSTRALVQILRQGPPAIKVTFPEGWTARQMGTHLETLGVVEASPFVELVMKGKNEGYLFPDTYFFDQGIAPQIVIDRMVKRFHEKEPKDIAERAKALKLSYQQIVTLASLVEKEARVPAEQPLIAGVFLNRLKKRWRLESCATVQYALGTWKPQLTYKDLEIESPYNTYRHAGLPPGPICNPGAAALDAAAHPETTEMMFFVAEGGGTHRFSKYYTEHLAAQKQKRVKRKAASGKR